MKNYLIAHDLGTSCDKAVLISSSGEVLRVCSENYPVQIPKNGFAVQYPKDWWKAFCACNHQLLYGLDGKEVAAVSLCSQLMCALAVDQHGTPLYPAIIWADTRAGKEARQLEGRVGEEEFYRITGMRAAAGYTLPKLMWLKKQQPQIYKRTYRFLNVKDFINFRLTGQMATDPECAAYMHCADWRTGDWSQTLLDAAEIDREKLPVILPIGSIVGEVTSEAALESGLPAGTPVIMGTGDGGAATLGAGVIDPGDAYTSLGTSSWVSVVTGSKQLDPERGISKLIYLDTLRDSGTMQAGGYSYSWLRNTLCGEERIEAKQTGKKDYILIDHLAETASPGAGGVLFLPYLLGERSPYWDTDLRGAFLGISSHTKKGDICRSVLEGVAMHLKMILARIMNVNQISTLNCMNLVGGGASSTLWRHIFADVYGMPVYSDRLSDVAGAMGVAVIAGTAIKMFPDRRVIRDLHGSPVITEPNMEHHQLYQELSEIFQYAGQACMEVSHRLVKLEINKEVKD